MVRIGLGLVLVSAWFAAPVAISRQLVPPAQHPSFAGTWTPSEPARTDVLFSNGLGWIPGNGQLIIEQRPDRFTLTKEVPDDKLDPILDVNGQYFKTVVYRIIVPAGRRGGFGAAGDQRPSSWQGDRLVFQDSRSGGRPLSMTFSLDGERLKLETHSAVGGGRENNIAEWFTRVR